MKQPQPKCKICRNRFTPIRSSLEQVCQDDNCRTQWAMSVIEKRKEKQIKEKKQSWNKEKLELKEKLKSLSDWKNDLQKEINAIIREIDKGHGCIATGSYQGQMHAGHYISVGSNSTLRFHLENIWLQSMHSNSWKGGDTLRYQEGIISLYGNGYLEYLNSLQYIKTIQLSSDDIKEKIPVARSILKWIKLQDRKFTTEERLELRVKFNKQLGIYGY